MTGPSIPGLAIATLLVALTVSVLAFVFVFRYRRVTYRRTGEGRHVMRFSVVIGLTYGLTAASPLLQMVPLTVAILVQLALFGWAALEMYGRNVLFTEAQHNPRPCPCPHHQPHDPEGG